VVRTFVKRQHVLRQSRSLPPVTPNEPWVEADDLQLLRGDLLCKYLRREGPRVLGQAIRVPAVDSFALPEVDDLRGDVDEGLVPSY